jgi:hypothetical protein
VGSRELCGAGFQDAELNGKNTSDSFLNLKILSGGFVEKNAIITGI